jgi:hypothetical protein
MEGKEVVNKEVKKLGRPTKYHDGMPDILAEFFNRPTYREVTEQTATASGKVVEIKRTRPNLLPSVEAFCAENTISKETFYKWTRKYPIFMDAFKDGRQKAINHLIQHGLNGDYNPGFTKFILQNISDYKDKVEHSFNPEDLKISINLGEYKANE